MMNDPTQNMSYNYGAAAGGGMSTGNIQIVDVNSMKGQKPPE